MQPSDAFHIETSHFIYTANQMNGFCMKYNMREKWFKYKTFYSIRMTWLYNFIFHVFFDFRALNLDVDLSLVKTSFGILNHPLKY